MRWTLFLVILLLAPVVRAGEGKVIKVLPLYLNNKGNDSLLPSLYERDAYQAFLRQHPDKRKAIRFAVQWKAREVDTSNLHVVVETRGVQGNSFVTRKIEHSLTKTGTFSKWDHVDVTGKDFETMGELTAWRVTLWEGDHKLSEQKSFLW
jgi:hypothetical protein